MPPASYGPLDALNDPSARHAILTHFPVVLSIGVLLLTIASAAMKGANRTLRTTALVASVLLLISALVAVRSGDAAEAAVGNIPQVARDLVHEHEEQAERVWLFALAIVLAVATGWAKPRRAPLLSSIAAAVVALVSVGWIGQTAHHGGTLVYVYGVGTPKPLADADLRSDEEKAAGFADVRIAHFVTKVQPLLDEHCQGCHGGEDPPANLDLTSITSILEGGDTGPAVIPGKPNEGVLMRALSYEDEEIAMPPDEKLSDDAITAIAAWIRDGAVWTE